jgi:pimeloyl-ACP methyl ester carboxylesterase
MRPFAQRWTTRSRAASQLLGGLSWPPFTKDLPLSELKAKYERPSSRWLEVDGVRVHYAIEGREDGPTLVLVHGLMSSLHTWDGWVRELGSEYRIVRFDLPGFGLTGPDPRGRYDGAELIRFFEEFRRALGVESMYLAGNSLGGFVSWYYAVAHPERVKKLVLVDPLGYAQEPLPFIKLLATSAGRWLGLHLDPRGTVAKGVYDVFGDRTKVTPDVIRRYQDMSLRPGNRGALVDFCVELMRWVDDNPYQKEIGKLAVPTLLMWGTDDRWIPPAHVREWQRDVPGLRTRLYEGVGHVPMEEIPERTARDALAFFTDEGQSQPAGRAW